MTDLAPIFDRIYKDNLWNGVESRSGPGSGDLATAHLVHILPNLVAELGILSVGDIGCGDGHWMPDLPGYVGADVSAEAIKRAKANHPERAYYQLRATYAEMTITSAPDTLIICRDVIQHLSLAEGIALLDKIRDSGAAYLLASTYEPSDNIDIENGDFYSPNLSDYPFDLGKPLELIFDGYDYGIPDLVRDPAKFLGLWRLS
jgi:hypothetical protein